VRRIAESAVDYRSESVTDSIRSPRCSRCKAKLTAWVDTDGHGGTVDYVEPCPVCCSRIVAVRRQPWER
jgi:hypothetical protein